MSNRHMSAHSRTYDEGLRFWRARDAYRVQSLLYGLVGALVLMEGVFFLFTGQWDTGLVTVGTQILLVWGGFWLLRQGVRRVQTWVRTWWCGLVVLTLLSLTLTGCEPMAREVAKLHGVKVDPFPGPCAPESFQVGTCVAVKQGGVK